MMRLAAAGVRPSPSSSTGAARTAQSLGRRWFARSARQPSALVTPQQQIESELALSSARRLERIARLEELQQLEALLNTHKVAEGQSLLWSLQVHWSKHGPVLAAFAGGCASMTASFALWKHNYLQGKERDELKAQTEVLKSQLLDGQKLDAREARDITSRIQAYRDSQTAIVSVPATAAPASSGWFGRSSAPVQPAPTPAGAAPAATLRHTTYKASKSDLAKLAQLQQEVQQAYTTQPSA